MTILATLAVLMMACLVLIVIAFRDPQPLDHAREDDGGPL